METGSELSPIVVRDDAAELFARGGEMGALMQRTDWGATPLGPVSRWPQSLRTAVSICLHSRFPMLLWWGPELVMLYNDAYRPILGTVKHPRSLGQRGRDCWPEIWDTIGPMLEGVMQQGDATWSDDQLLMLERNGYPEECYFTFSYSPIYDEDAKVGGVFTAVTETTARVIGERHMLTLRDLAASTTAVSTVLEALQLAAAVLVQHPADLPFAQVFLDQSGTLTPITANAAWDAAVVPADVVQRVADTGTAEVLHGVRLARGADGHEAEASDAAEASDVLVMPIAQASSGQRYGVLVTGLNPHRAFDDDYQSYCDLVAGQIASACASASAYEEERRRAEALAQLDHAKTVFFSNVSHEFRTPITLSIGPAEDALADAEHPLPEVQRERLVLIQRNNQRLLKLVNGLLNFTRLESGRMQARFAPTDLPAFTAELASFFHSATERAGLRLVVDCPPLPELPAPVYVDRMLWENVVVNLLSNAFKYTLAGEIAVTVRAEGSADAPQVVLRVRDTGVGIAPDALPHIFERFHRVEGSRARSHEGSGIGLALVREIVQLHGGSVAAESVLDEGTTFIVRLPLGAEHLPQDQIAAADTTYDQAALAVHGEAAAYVEEALRWLPDVADATMPGEARAFASGGWGHSSAAGAMALPTDTAVQRRPRILLADDNADMRAYLQRLLCAQYDVLTAADGDEALRVARSQLPDLVVSDVMMPGKDGFALLQALRADPVTSVIPIVMLSARAGEDALIEGLAAGANDYLVKPFSARELLARIASRLEISRLRRESFDYASRLDAMLHAMVDGLYIYDAEGNLLSVNAAGRKMLGLAEDDEYLHSSVRERAARVLIRTEPGGEPLRHGEWGLQRIQAGQQIPSDLHSDVYVTTLDGRELLLNITGGPVRDATGQIIGAVVIARDVTERRALEQRTQSTLTALLAIAELLVSGARESEMAGEEFGQGGSARRSQRMRVLGDRLVSLVAQVSSCSRVKLVVAEEDGAPLQPLAATGLDPQERAAWLRDESRDSHLRNLLPDATVRALRAGEVVLVDYGQGEFAALPNPNALQQVLLAPLGVGEELVGVLSLSLGVGVERFTEADRSLAGAVGKLAALVVERERLLAERERSRAQVIALEDANRRMDEFLGVAGHELRTPLTVIKANVQLWQSLSRQVQAEQSAGGDGARVNPRVMNALVLSQRTVRQVDRLVRLVDELVDVSRIQAGKLELRLERCDLAEIVRDVVEGQRMTANGRTITLEVTPPEVAVPVRGDPDRLSQVVINLLTNALKYSSERTPVEVRLVHDDAQATVTVKDSGPGIPANETARIWEAFHRVAGIEVLSGSGIGLGLGLHIAKTLIDRHGGEIAVSSVPGEGSAFWFTLPIIGAEA